MNKANVEIIVTEAINFLAVKYDVTKAEIIKGLEDGHVNLTNAFSSLLKTGMGVEA